MHQSHIWVRVKHKEHCNIDSFPLRFGFTLSEDTDCMLLLEAEPSVDWRYKDRLIYPATLVHPDTDERYSGTFVVMVKQNGPMLVTAWRNDIETEYYLSSVMKLLRQSGELTTQDLLNFHPQYKRQALSSHADLVLALSANKSAAQIKSIQDAADLAIEATKAKLRKLTVENEHLRLQNETLKQKDELHRLISEWQATRQTQPADKLSMLQQGKAGFSFGLSAALAAALLAGAFHMMTPSTPSDSHQKNSANIPRAHNATWMPDYALTTQQAINAVNATATVCGTVVQVNDFGKGTYLNFNKAFPNTLFSAVIWHANSEQVLSNTPLTEYLNQDVCVAGQVTTYRGRTQIVVREEGQLRIYE